MSDIIASDKKPTEGIPEGDCCYEPIGWEGSVYRVKPCSYREYTHYGTVRCNYLEVDSVDPTPHGRKAFIKAVKHFGSEDAVMEIDNGGLIWDGVKECGINEDDI